MTSVTLPQGSGGGRLQGMESNLMSLDKARVGDPCSKFQKEDETCSFSWLDVEGGWYWLCTRSDGHHGQHVAEGLYEVLSVHAPDDCLISITCATPEQASIMREFTDLLNQASRDGGRKRGKGEKVDWRVDPGHAPAMYRHLGRWENFEIEDKDSGAHPLVHAAWRALAIAWQETHSEENEDAGVV